MLHVISLGAGVQSSTMALMASKGLIDPMPDAAVFSDTGAEPKEVYRWIDWLEPKLAFPVFRVSGGNMVEHIIEAVKGDRFASAPFFTESKSGVGVGMLRRQCTKDFKLVPLNRKQRELAGLKPRQRVSGPQVTSWVGISTDEAMRMRPSREAWKVNRYPLIDLGMARWDCLRWMERQGYPRPPRSACTFCPYHSDAEWRRIKREGGQSWWQAVRIDRVIREGVRGTKERLYLHRSLKPLDEVDFSTMEDLGQIDAFGNECEGICGV